MKRNPIAVAPQWFPALELAKEQAWSPWMVGYVVVFVSGSDEGFLHYWSGSGKPTTVSPVRIYQTTTNQKMTWVLAARIAKKKKKRISLRKRSVFDIF